jgi:hypothetical protein
MPDNLALGPGTSLALSILQGIATTVERCIRMSCNYSGICIIKILSLQCIDASPCQGRVPSPLEESGGEGMDMGEDLAWEDGVLPLSSREGDMGYDNTNDDATEGDDHGGGDDDPDSDEDGGENESDGEGDDDDDDDDLGPYDGEGQYNDDDLYAYF